MFDFILGTCLATVTCCTTFYFMLNKIKKSAITSRDEEIEKEHWVVSDFETKHRTWHKQQLLNNDTVASAIDEVCAAAYPPNETGGLSDSYLKLKDILIDYYTTGAYVEYTRITNRLREWANRPW